MRIPDEDIEELRQIHEKVTGEKISHDEAILMGRNLVSFGELWQKLLGKYVGPGDMIISVSTLLWPHSIKCAGWWKSSVDTRPGQRLSSGAMERSFLMMSWIPSAI